MLGSLTAARSTQPFDAFLEGRMKASFAFGLILFCSSILLGQTGLATKPGSPASPITQQQILELPKRRSYRPRLTLQKALEIADVYIAKEKIDISGYYLLEVKLILYGDKDNKDPSWYFWWVNEDGASGHYVEIV